MPLSTFAAQLFFGNWICSFRSVAPHFPAKKVWIPNFAGMTHLTYRPSFHMPSFRNPALGTATEITR